MSASAKKKASSSQTDEDFILAYVADALDGDLGREQQKRYDDIVKAHPKLKISSTFQQQRGDFQLTMQEFSLSTEQLQSLRNLIYGEAKVAEQESEAIDTISRGELKGDVLRVAATVVLLGGLVWAAVSIFMPVEKPKFDAIQALGYEAMIMEQEPLGRLDLPTQSLADVTDFLKNYPGLEFSPVVISQLPEDWQVNGASLIDYDTLKVAVVQYGRSSEQDGVEEKLFVFSYRGVIDDLPSSDPGTLNNDFAYKTYSSPELNIVAWAPEQEVVSLIIGKSSAQDLAKIAYHGAPKADTSAN